MDGDVVTPGGIVIPAGAMTWRFSRGTGPGGQGAGLAAKGKRARPRGGRELIRRSAHARSRAQGYVPPSMRTAAGLARHAECRGRPGLEPLGDDGLPALVALAVGPFAQLLERP